MINLWLMGQRVVSFRIRLYSLHDYWVVICFLLNLAKFVHWMGHVWVNIVPRLASVRRVSWSFLSIVISDESLSSDNSLPQIHVATAPTLPQIIQVNCIPWIQHFNWSSSLSSGCGYLAWFSLYEHAPVLILSRLGDCTWFWQIRF